MNLEASNAEAEITSVKLGSISLAGKEGLPMMGYMGKGAGDTSG